MLFVHFSLGASIGAVTTMLVLPQAREQLREAEPAVELLSRI
jgi:gas vesicle protein